MPRYRSRALLIFGIVAALLVLIAGRSMYRQQQIVALDFQPEPAAILSHHPERTGIVGLTEVSFLSSDGIRIAGWYRPSNNRAAVVITHGTNADRSSRLSEIRILTDAGFGVLAFDWPGNGGSEGSVQWNAGERHALAAAVDWLAARPELDQEKLGGLGFSMGGYVMAQVAAQDPRLRAVVLAAAPTDFAEYTHWIHRRWGWFSELPADWALRRSGMPLTELRPIDVIHQVAPRPVLILGGSADEVIPEAMTRRLFAAAGEPKSLWIVPGAHHGDYADIAAAEYQRQLVSFFSHSLQVE